MVLSRYLPPLIGGVSALTFLVLSISGVNTLSFSIKLGRSLAHFLAPKFLLFRSFIVLSFSLNPCTSTALYFRLSFLIGMLLLLLLHFRGLHVTSYNKNGAS